MAAGTIRPIQPFSSSVFDRGTVPVREAANQTFKKGALLILNASGYVEEAGTAPATVKYVALQNGQNNSVAGAAHTSAFLITDSDLFSATQSDALAQTDIGAVYGVVKDATTGFWYVDRDDTGDQVVVERFDATPGLGNIGDTNARVIIRFQAANLATA